MNEKRSVIHDVNINIYDWYYDIILRYSHNFLCVTDLTVLKSNSFLYLSTMLKFYFCWNSVKKIDLYVFTMSREKVYDFSEAFNCTESYSV